MKNSNLNHLIALAALVLLAGSVEKTHAQNNWTLAGVSPGGGYIIIGNSAPTDLGSLGPSTTPVFLSAQGSDIITLEAGNTASSGAGYVITMDAPNDTLNNYGTIHLTGGSGAAVLAEGVNNVVNNWGTISGVYGGVYLEGNGGTLNNWSMITGEYPVYIDANSNTVNNHGTISATTTYGFEIYGTGNTVNNWGNITSTTDYPIYAEANNTIINNWGTISSPYDPIWVESGTGLTINNWGRITSNGGDYSVYNDASNFTLNNYSGGTITSGYDTVYSDGANTTINNWGTVSCAGDYALDIEAANTTINNYQGGVISAAYDPIYVDGSNTTINNWGAVTSSGEYGIYSDSDYFTMNNWGTVTSLSSQALYNDGNYFALNNWGTLSSGGDGVDDYASNGVLKNWGMISGAGLGIYIDGNNNTLDLNGHSSVIGKISVLGTTNVVNLNFTGLSPATIAVLTAQLVPQGVNSGNPTSATFSLRGVNYNIDPAIIYFHPSSYQLQAKTPNQAVIGRNLDSLTANPAPGTPFFNLLNAIDASGNVPGALDAISPLKYAVYGDLAIQNTTSIVQDVDRRLNNLRDGSESVDTTGAGGDTVAAVVTGDPSKDGSKESKQVVQPEAQENRWGFFASGDGLFYRGGSSNSSLENGKSNSAGTLAGVDGKVGENAVIGTFFAYNNSAVDLGNDGSHATIESYSGGLYGAYHQDGFYANSLAAYTRNNYTSSSNVLFPGFATTGNGSTHGNQYSANIDGGYDFHLGERLTVGPIGGLQYVHLDVNGFNESGGILALGDQSMNSLQSRLGAKAEYKIATTATSSFGAETYVAWQHEYLDNSRGIGASFEGSGLAPFVVQTGSPDRDAAVVGAALNFTFHKRLTLFADYELQMWNASYFEQSVNGGAKISF